MADLKSEFEQAQIDVKSLSKRPGSSDMLLLYSLFKQVNNGDVTGVRPGMLDMIGRAKYDAWERLKGITAEDAMRQYVVKVKELQS